MKKRCGEPKRHTPHWWPRRAANTDTKYVWCDGKPPNPNLVTD